MDYRRDVFQAIADPTRRAIIGLLAAEPRNLKRVVENFPISRPAISKHIRILTECGLVVIEQRGRETICRSNLQALKEVSSWVEQYRQCWIDRLDALGQLLENNK